MSGQGKKFPIIILAAVLSLSAAACGSGASGPGAPGSGGSSGSGSGGDEDYQSGSGVPFYGEAIDRAQDASDISEQRKLEIEENMEEAESGF